MGSSRIWMKAFSILFLVAGLTLVASLKAFGGSQGAYAQQDGRLTWLKLSDRKPAAMAFSPNFTEDRLVLIGNSNKDNEFGIWRSTDGGETWVKSSDGIPEAKEVNVYDIVFSPDFANDQTVFATMNKQRVTLGEATGALFRSTDAGLTWVEMEMTGFPSRGARPLQDMVSLSLSPNFTQDGIMFAVVSAVGLYRSTDRGNTWQQLLAENANEIQVSPAFAEDHLVAAATANSGILFSTDGGDTWIPRNSGLEGARNFKRVIFSSNFKQDRSILTMSVSHGIFITRNAGESWESIGKPPEGEQMLLMATNSRFNIDGYVAYSLRNAAIFLSKDLGRTWEDTDSAGILGGQIQAMFMPPDYATSQTLYAVSVFGGLHRYHPVLAGSEAAATATAVAVNATATAVAIPTAMALEQQIKEETLKETGCITFYIPPMVLLGIGALRRRARRWQKDGE